MRIPIGAAVATLAMAAGGASATTVFIDFEAPDQSVVDGSAIGVLSDGVWNVDFSTNASNRAFGETHGASELDSYDPFAGATAPAWFDGGDHFARDAESGQQGASHFQLEATNFTFKKVSFWGISHSGNVKVAAYDANGSIIPIFRTFNVNDNEWTELEVSASFFGLSEMRRISIFDGDTGVGVDNMSFLIPLPAPTLMAGAGLLAVGIRRRR